MNAPAILDASGRPIEPTRSKAMASAYVAASRDHQDMATWMPFGQSAQAALSYERDLIAARIHDIARNDGWASAALDRQVDNVVGSGWILSAKPNAASLGIDPDAAIELADSIESAWTDYADDPGFFCDAGRNGPAGAQLALAYRHRVMDGEALAILYWLPRGGPYATAIQIIDPDRLSNPLYRMDTPNLRGGVELDDYGVSVAYHIQVRHPGDDLLALPIWERVERETAWGRPVVIHARELGRAGQVRGAAPLSPILKKLKQVTRYDEAELQAAVLNAILAAFVTTPMDHEMASEALSGGELPAYQKERLAYYKDAPLRLPGAQVGFLYPGEQVNFTPTQHPNNNAESFIRSALRNVASTAGISYEQLTMDWSQVNYSSARAALIEVWRGLTARKNNFAAQFMQQWYAAWLEEAIDLGHIVMPKGAPPFAAKRAAYTRADWIGPGRGWVDPLKEADAAVTRLDGNLSTFEREGAEQGRDWRSDAMQRRREQKFFEKLGINSNQPLRTARPQPDQGQS